MEHRPHLHSSDLVGARASSVAARRFATLGDIEHVQADVAGRLLLLAVLAGAAATLEDVPAGAHARVNEGAE
jgi:hypothetical protein